MSVILPSAPFATDRACVAFRTPCSLIRAHYRDRHPFWTNVAKETCNVFKSLLFLRSFGRLRGQKDPSEWVCRVKWSASITQDVYQLVASLMSRVLKRSPMDCEDPSYCATVLCGGTSLNDFQNFTTPFSVTILGRLSFVGCRLFFFETIT